MQKLFLSAAAIFGGTAVILGAFGAHALKSKLTEQQLQVFETAVKYQFIHALALMLIVLLADRFKFINGSLIGWFFISGIVFFSGSLYLLSTSTINGLQSMTKVFGPVTPVGGLLF